MLIIQIALGIVLAVIVLMFLPQIFSLGIWIALLALGIAVVVGIFFLAIEHLAVTLALAIVVGAVAFGEFFSGSKDRLKANIDKEKQRRRGLGYED
jgi:hypothetical protein